VRMGTLSGAIPQRVCRKFAVWRRIAGDKEAKNQTKPMASRTDAIAVHQAQSYRLKFGMPPLSKTPQIGGFGNS
jgi:hypothetical protein